MPASPRESTEGQPTDVYYGFRLPFRLESLPAADRYATAAFLGAICDRLSTPSIVFRFDGDGALRMTQVTASKYDACEAVSPQGVFEQIREVFVTLCLDPPPPESEESVPPAVFVSTDLAAQRHRTRLSLRGLCAWLRTRSQPAVPDREASYRQALRARDDQRRRQFVSLRDWFQRQWNEGNAREAIRRRFSKSTEK